MIRIVTWNCCRGKPAVKFPRLLATNPHVTVIQECAHPSDIVAHKQLWCGDNLNQGLMVQVNDGLTISPSRRKRISAKYFLPVRVHGAVEFNLLAVWAKPALQRPLYVTTLFRGVEAYRDFIKSGPTILLGDLNTARYLSAKDSHVEFVNMLRDDFGLVSAYHEYYGAEHGHEVHNTYFDRTKKGKPFHIDYCFLPKSWLPQLTNVAVGCFRDWQDLSDHVPLYIDLEM